MSLFNLRNYPRVILLFDDGAYTEYTPGNLATTKDLNEANLVIVWNDEGKAAILKDRWGYGSKFDVE